MRWSVGLGLTDACNLDCPHCYSRRDGTRHLTLDDVRRVLDSLEVSAVNLGTGETFLNPDFGRIFAYLMESGVRVGLTSNGSTIVRLSSRDLGLLNDVDVSLDFPTRVEQDRFRGEGAWRTAVQAIERCVAAGVETSIACCLMNANHRRMEAMTGLAARLGTRLRVNVYKPANTPRFSPTYDEFWEGIRALVGTAGVVASGEPIVNVALGIRREQGGCVCGLASFRVRPDRTIVPCVYWNRSDVKIDDLSGGDDVLLTSEEFRSVRRVPDACLECPHVEECGGGCASRRLYTGGLDAPDAYCPYTRGEVLRIAYTQAPVADLVHAGYLCTVILDPRS